MKQKFSIAMSLAVILAMLLTAGALADQVVNNVDLSVDAAFETMSLNVGGSDGTTTLRIVEQNGDGKNGCNLTGSGSQLTVSVASSNPSVATVSPSSVTFNACGDTRILTVTPVTAGSTDITLTFVSVTTGSSGVTSSSFDLLPGSFKANVAPPPNTAPVVTVTGVAHGATYEFGTLPAAGCSVDDFEDGDSTFAAALSSISGPLAAYGLGTQTATCEHTDAGGLYVKVEATYEIVDTTAPGITFVGQTPAANGNGWNNTDVTLEWSCSDNVGVVASSVSETVSTEGENQSATGTCEDVAGNTASDTQSGINIDKTAPAASATASPNANSNGWNNSAVTVSFDGVDDLSGIDFCDADVVLSSEGADQSASGTCTDKAGNVSAAAVASSIDIDLTNPNVSLDGGPANGASYYFGSVPAAPTCSASDELSGLNGTCSVSGYATTVGTHTVSASASDKAGNSNSASATYTVLAWTLNGFYAPVDMGGVWNTVRGGSTVPLKFEVFAGSTELTSTSVVQSFTVTGVACNGSTADDIELTTTGGTSLRYDATAGQFIQNWQTPRAAGSCYRVTMTTQDASILSALFKLK